MELNLLSDESACSNVLPVVYNCKECVWSSYRIDRKSDTAFNCYSYPLPAYVSLHLSKQFIWSHLMIVGLTGHCPVSTNLDFLLAKLSISHLLSDY